MTSTTLGASRHRPRESSRIHPVSSGGLVRILSSAIGLAAVANLVFRGVGLLADGGVALLSALVTAPVWLYTAATINAGSRGAAGLAAALAVATVVLAVGVPATIPAGFALHAVYGVLGLIVRRFRTGLPSAAMAGWSAFHLTIASLILTG